MEAVPATLEQRGIYKHRQWSLLEISQTHWCASCRSCSSCNTEGEPQHCHISLSSSHSVPLHPPWWSALMTCLRSLIFSFVHSLPLFLSLITARLRIHRHAGQMESVFTLKWFTEDPEHKLMWAMKRSGSETFTCSKLKTKLLPQHAFKTGHLTKSYDASVQISSSFALDLQILGNCHLQQLIDCPMVKANDMVHNVKWGGRKNMWSDVWMTTCNLTYTSMRYGLSGEPKPARTAAATQYRLCLRQYKTAE